MTYDEHLEIARSLPPYELTERCDNCDHILSEDEGQLIQVHTSRKTVTMNVCERCATPIQLDVVKLSGSGLWWIYLVNGVGKNHRVVEAIGLTIPEALDKFREQFELIMNLDLVCFKWK